MKPTKAEVLMVDDNSYNLQAVVDGIRSFKFSTDIANDGNDAFELIKRRYE